MESILYELWQGRMNPQERRVEYDQESRKLLRLIEKNHERLCESLNEQQIEIFEKYKDSVTELSDFTEFELF